MRLSIVCPQSKLCVSIPWFLNMVAVVGFEAATSGAQYVMAYHQHKVLSWGFLLPLIYVNNKFSCYQAACIDTDYTV